MAEAQEAGREPRAGAPAAQAWFCSSTERSGELAGLGGCLADAKVVLVQTGAGGEECVEEPPQLRRRESGASFSEAPARTRWRSLAKYVLDPRRMIHKYFLLLLICLFIPGPYYADSILSTYKGPVSETMHLTNEEFGMLFALSSLTGVLCGPGGFVVSRFGRTRMALGAGFACALGSLFTVLGFQWRMLSVMLVARFVFWLALYVLLLVQTLLVYSIFKGRALVVAYSVLVTACRLGGCFAFFLSGPILRKYGVERALWVSVCAVFVAFAATLLFAYLFRGSATAHTVRPLLEGRGAARAKVFSLSLLRDLPRSAVALMISVGALYGTVFPFEVVADDMLQSNFGFNADTAGYLLTVIPAVPVFSPLFSPLLGSSVPRKLSACAVGFTMLVTAQGLLCTLDARAPVVAFVLMGLGFAVSVCAIWTTLPELIRLEAPEELAKDLEGLATGMGYVALGVCQFSSNFVVGVLKDMGSYRWVCVWLGSLATAGALCIGVCFVSHAPLAETGSITSQEEGRAGCDDAPDNTEAEVSIPDVNGRGTSPTLEGNTGSTLASPVVHEDYYAT